MEPDLAPWITPAILVAVFAWLRSDIHRAEARLNERLGRIENEFAGVKKELGEVKRELGEMKKELAEVVKDLAEMKGKLTFVESYILRRNDSAPEPAAE